MNCYNCGFEAEGDLCPACGAPLRAYRVVMEYAAAYYNDGLERAKAHDLSGATRSLQMCLKLDKNNIDARNLLGLIFYQTGEAVGAITQWVISKNLRPEGNPVDSYLGELRNSPDYLSNMNKAIKNYNFALRSVRKKHYDAARIQLKKVLQINPKLLKARQMLALLYMQREDYARARYELLQCEQIDVGNEKTSQFQNEIDRVIARKNMERAGSDSHKKRAQAFAYRSGNETIIQPAGGIFSTGGAISLISVALGLTIGLSAMFFLILPDRVKKAQLAANERIAVISEELDAKAADVSEYRRQVEELQAQVETLTGKLSGYENIDAEGSAPFNLASAASLYLSGDYKIADIAAYMEKVTEDKAQELQDQEYGKLYRSLVNACGKDLSGYFFNLAANAMKENNTTEAVRLYGLAAQYDSTDVKALYNYAEATELSGETDAAKLLYGKVMELFPNENEAQNAEAKIAALNR